MPEDALARIAGPPMETAGLRWPAEYPARAQPAKPAIIFADRVTSYAELDRQASAFVGILQQFSIQPGERVAYLGRNSDVYFAVVFGAMRAGAVLVPLNWRCTAAELGFILGDAAPALLICDAEFRAVARDAGPGIRVLETAEELYPLLTATAPAGATPVPPDEPAMLMYTSGTTGKPKGVVITQRMMALARHAEIISPDYADWRDNDIILSPMPNFHMGGLSWLLGAFCRGLTAVITSDVTAKGLIALCQAHNITRTFIVPTVVRGILEELRAQGLRLPHLREIHYGAAPMDAALLTAAMAEIGCQFLQHFGMTENTGTATRLGPADHDPARPELLRSVGKPQPGLRLEIRRPDNSVARRGEAGEISLSSPTVMREYWRRPDATAQALEDGWYRSGDGGYLDAEGFLYLTDRIKDMVISGGENVYPAEVEAALRIHPAVLDAAVFGLPDPHWGEIVVAAVEFRAGQSADEAALKAHLRAQIAAYKVPKRFALNVTLARTATGKIQRAAAKRNFGS